jgi:hypothetical protein
MQGVSHWRIYARRGIPITAWHSRSVSNRNYSERNQAMTRTKLGLLGLCAVVFGLMAFSTSAQATAGAKWLILNSLNEKKEGSTLHAAVGLKFDTLLILHSEILKIKVLFECSNLKTENALLQKEGTIAKEYNAEGKPVGSKIVFTNCITKLNGVTAPECEPNAEGKNLGTIKTNSGHALIVLHKLEPSGELDDLLLVLPDTGETFATVEMGASCPIGTKVAVIGHVTLKDCKGNVGFLEHAIEHLVEVFTPLTTLWTISKTTEHVATLLGSSWSFLEGEHKGLKWAGDPA